MELLQRRLGRIEGGLAGAIGRPQRAALVELRQGSLTTPSRRSTSDCWIVGARQDQRDVERGLAWYGRPQTIRGFDRGRGRHVVAGEVEVGGVVNGGTGHAATLAAFCQTKNASSCSPRATRLPRADTYNTLGVAACRGAFAEDRSRDHLWPVQGVGYRDWTQAVARQLGLRGWVRNRLDQTVEALFAGEAATVDDMVAACRRQVRRSRGSLQ